MALQAGTKVRYVGEQTGQLSPGMRGKCVDDEDDAGFVEVKFAIGVKRVVASDLEEI